PANRPFEQRANRHRGWKRSSAGRRKGNPRWSSHGRYAASRCVSGLKGQGTLFLPPGDPLRRIVRAIEGDVVVTARGIGDAGTASSGDPKVERVRGRAAIRPDVTPGVTDPGDVAHVVTGEDVADRHRATVRV